MARRLEPKSPSIIPGSEEQHLATDDGGVAIVQLKAGEGAESIQIDASDGRGASASSNIELQSRDGEDQILLRSERAVYRAGDRIDLKVLSTRQHGAAYVDVVKDGQTILTRDLDIENGQAALTLTATPEMAGTLDLHAYAIRSKRAACRRPSPRLRAARR